MSNELACIVRRNPLEPCTALRMLGNDVPNYIATLPKVSPASQGPSHLIHVPSGSPLGLGSGPQRPGELRHAAEPRHIEGLRLPRCGDCVVDSLDQSVLFG